MFSPLALFAAVVVLGNQCAAVRGDHETSSEMEFQSDHTENLEYSSGSLKKHPTVLDIFGSVKSQDKRSFGHNSRISPHRPHNQHSEENNVYAMSHLQSSNIHGGKSKLRKQSKSSGTWDHNRKTSANKSSRKNTPIPPNKNSRKGTAKQEYGTWRRGKFPGAQPRKSAVIHRKIATKYQTAARRTQPHDWRYGRRSVADNVRLIALERAKEEGGFLQELVKQLPLVRENPDGAVDEYSYTR